MNTFSLEIVTPEKAFPLRDVEAVNAPGEWGPLTVLAGHQAMVCCLKDGPVRIRDDEGREEAWRVASGLLTVTREKVTLLVQDAARVESPPPAGPPGSP